MCVYSGGLPYPQAIGISPPRFCSAEARRELSVAKTREIGREGEGGARKERKGGRVVKTSPIYRTYDVIPA